MEILGVGGAELIAILIIMLVVAGPKRMIQWAYIMGKYVAKLRAMWAETMSYMQKELDEAGVDIKLPKEPPTRGSLKRTLTQSIEKVASPITKPLQETLDETRTQLEQVKAQATIAESNGKKPPGPAPDGDKPDLGTWSQPGDQQ